MLLAGRHCERLFQTLETVILDEWHELIGSGGHPGGTGAQLRDSAHPLQTWAISATIGNLEEAARHASGKSEIPV